MGTPLYQRYGLRRYGPFRDNGSGTEHGIIYSPDQEAAPRLRAALAEYPGTLSGLARRASVSRPHLYELQRGSETVMPRTVWKLAQAIREEIEELQAVEARLQAMVDEAVDEAGESSYDCDADSEIAKWKREWKRNVTRRRKHE